MTGSSSRSRTTPQSLPPTQTLELDTGLSLVPRIKFHLTVHRSDYSVNPIDDWKLKRSLLDYLKSTFSVAVPEEDLEIRRFKGPKKRKREDPIAHGTLFIRDLSFLTKKLSFQNNNDDDDVGENEDDAVKLSEKTFLDWRNSVVEKMDGIDLNIEGLKLKLSVAVPDSDDFEKMRKGWEEFYAFGGGRGYSMNGRQQPDTIVVRGVPSRWFAEPRVSSKPSMLVTHTIFSMFGKIRNLDVAEDNDGDKDADDDSGVIVSGLQCKIVVRFEKYRDFYNALKALCGRSLQKQGSSLRADYEVTWDRDGFFRNVRNRTEESSRWSPAAVEGHHRSEAPRRQSHVSRFSPDDSRPKRFKEQRGR